MIYVLHLNTSRLVLNQELSESRKKAEPPGHWPKVYGNINLLVY